MPSKLKKLSIKSQKQPKSLRIAMLVDAWFPFVGGGQIHVLQLSKALKKEFSHQIDFFYPPNSHIISRFFWSIFSPVHVYFIHQKKRYSIIHSHGYNSGLAAKITSLLTNTPCVHTVHGSNSLDRDIPGLKTSIERWLLTGINYNAQITVSSTFLRHQNKNRKIVVIHNGVDTSNFDLEEVSKNTTPTIIWVGRKDDPVKGFDILLTAIDIVKKQIPSLKTTIISGGNITGKKLIRAYKKSHLFVLPSLSEGQPITLLEAWAAKLPVIVTNVGENSKMVVNNFNGILVKPNNSAILAKKILYVLKNPVKVRKLGLNGYKIAKRDFTWKIAAQKTNQLYHEVLYKP